MGVQLNLNEITGLMRKNKLILNQVAKQIGISQTSLSYKLSGKKQFKADEICSLANIFKVNAGIFFTPCDENNSTL